MKNRITLILFLFVANATIAGNYLSGSISYTYVSLYNYRFTLNVYTLDSSLADSCFLLVHFGNGDSAFLPRTNGPSSFCPATHDGIMVTSTIKKSVYYIEHTFAGPGTYTITAQFLKRTYGINNITNSGNTSPTLSAQLIINPFLGDNNSVQFSNYVPVIYDTINHIMSYNPGAVDVDGDSLSYELVIGTGYYPPASSVIFSIDSMSGNVLWNAPITPGTYSYLVRISEWRHSGGLKYYIGNSMMEIYNIIYSPLSLFELSKNDLELKLSPNPFTSQTTLAFSTEQKNTEVRIADVLGKEIRTLHFSGKELIIEKGEMERGIYFVEITDVNKNRVNRKIVVE